MRYVSVSCGKVTLTCTRTYLAPDGIASARREGSPPLRSSGPDVLLAGRLLSHRRWVGRRSKAESVLGYASIIHDHGIRTGHDGRALLDEPLRLDAVETGR